MTIDDYRCLFFMFSLSINRHFSFPPPLFLLPALVSARVTEHETDLSKALARYDLCSTQYDMPDLVREEFAKERKRQVVHQTNHRLIEAMKRGGSCGGGGDCGDCGGGGDCGDCG
tara:strand:+ start:348 stop:692 length:345 start_codon:yes stop_codon:yes gene_type:complete